MSPAEAEEARAAILAVPVDQREWLGRQLARVQRSATDTAEMAGELMDLLLSMTETSLDGEPRQ